MRTKLWLDIFIEIYGMEDLNLDTYRVFDKTRT
jgi:hypothetical protein